MRNTIHIHQAVFDRYPANIAVVGANGAIKTVNQSWQKFYADNDGQLSKPWTEINYLDVCEKAARDDCQHARAVLSGFDSLFKKKTKQFQYLYPCHSPTHKAWYIVRIVPLELDHDQLYMVVHEDRTTEVVLRQALESSSDTDGLTGLANRRGCQQFLDRQWRRDLRTKTEMSVLTVEIDDHEDYRSHYGSTIGNNCVALISRAISTIVRRPSDFAARLGREEFAVILGTTTQRDALTIADRLRSNVETLAIESHDLAPNRRVTVSIGVASVTPHRHLNASELLEKSNQALVRAKSLGPDAVSK